MLFLIPTPIGNLADITLRALHVMQECDYLLCEDTRRSRILLNHYKIEKHLKSYHKFNEEKRKKEVLFDLEQGKKIGLLSDAGTPCIADPGFRLVQGALEEHIPITPLPGPFAGITALIASGLFTERFQFIGFLPKKKGELKKLFLNFLNYPGTTICYESPFRLKNSLDILISLDDTRDIVVARELTKKFEEFVRGKPSFLKEKWHKNPPKGEIVLLISGL